MAYVALPTALIQIGEAVKKEIFEYIRANQESFNTDIEALKQTAQVRIFDTRYSGTIAHYTTAEIDSLYPTYKAPVSATITSFVVTLLEASTSGNIEVGIEKSIDNGINWTPLLTTPVTVTGTTVGSISGGVAWVDVPSQSYSQNNLLRITINGLQVDQGDFHVSVYGEVG